MRQQGIDFIATDIASDLCPFSLDQPSICRQPLLMQIPSREIFPDIMNPKRADDSSGEDNPSWLFEGDRREPHLDQIAHKADPRLTLPHLHNTMASHLP